MTTSEKIQELYKKYLSNIDVKMEMVKNIGNHELSLINRKEGLYIRYLIGNTLNALEHQIYKFNILNRVRNFYISCALHSKIPILSDNLRTRKETPEYQSFNDNYIDSVLNYTMFFDFDSKNGEDSYNDSKIVKELLESYHVPFWIVPSSYSGIHIILGSQYLPDKKIEELINDIDKILTNIKDIYDLKSLDCQITDLKKLRKLEFSPIVDGSCVIPLTDEMFVKLKEDKSIISIESVLKNIDIKNHGLKIRTYGLSDEELKKNVLKFWSDFVA
jgi:hypothetical protein